MVQIIFVSTYISIHFLCTIKIDKVLGVTIPVATQFHIVLLLSALYQDISDKYFSVNLLPRLSSVAKPARNRLNYVTALNVHLSSRH